MGRRSRKRAELGVPEPVREEPPAVPSTPRLRARLEDAPKAPWHPFPLVELSVLAGMVLAVVGFITERPILLFGGVGLITVASLELAIREHFAGYRSHSTLLAAVIAIGAAAAIFPTSLPGEVLTAVGLLAGGIAFYFLRRGFAARARGLTFRA